eukprot:m.214523 g.214523  ORF g.214523 m.214523 type:complete len:333 (-) comp25583_c0_seq1:78-1076(-)
MRVLCDRLAAPRYAGAIDLPDLPHHRVDRVSPRETADPLNGGLQRLLLPQTPAPAHGPSVRLLRRRVRRVPTQPAQLWVDGDVDLVNQREASLTANRRIGVHSPLPLPRRRRSHPLSNAPRLLRLPRAQTSRHLVSPVRAVAGVPSRAQIHHCGLSRLVWWVDWICGASLQCAHWLCRHRAPRSVVQFWAWMIHGALDAKLVGRRWRSSPWTRWWVRWLWLWVWAVVDSDVGVFCRDGGAMARVPDALGQQVWAVHSAVWIPEDKVRPNLGRHLQRPSPAEPELPRLAASLLHTLPRVGRSVARPAGSASDPSNPASLRIGLVVGQCMSTAD